MMLAGNSLGRKGLRLRLAVFRDPGVVKERFLPRLGAERTGTQFPVLLTELVVEGTGGGWQEKSGDGKN